MRKTPVNRNTLLAKAHLAPKQLGMTDEDRRAVLDSLFGVSSCTRLNNKQLADLIRHFESRGWQAKKKTVERTGRGVKQQPRQSMPNDPQSKKIRALWLELHKKGIVRDPSEVALNKFVKRHTRVEQLAWLSAPQASAVIEALKAWRDRTDGQQQARR